MRHSDALLLDATDQSVTSARRSRLVNKQAPSADDRDYYYKNYYEDGNTNSRSPEYSRYRMQSDDDQQGRLMTTSPVDVVTTEDAPGDDGRSTNIHAESLSTLTSSWHRTAPSAGSIRTRNAPRLAVVNRYASVNTSTGSSTSGVDVSVSSSRSELLGLMRNGLTPTATTMTSTSLSSTAVAVAASSVDADCEDNVDEEDALSIYRSASFRRAIERGNSLGGGGGRTSTNYCPVLGSSGLSTASSAVTSSSSFGMTAATHVSSASARTPSARSSLLVKQSTNDNTEACDVLDLSLTGSASVSTDGDRNSSFKITVIGTDSASTSSDVTQQLTRHQAVDTGDDLDEVYSSSDAFSGGTAGPSLSYGFVLPTPFFV